MADPEEITKKKTRPEKFDYTGKEFLSAIESFAEQGYTDASIAYSLGDKFDGLRLNPEYFSRIKNEKGKNGKPTKRALAISQALARGRVNVNAAVRATYLQMALGQRTVKTTITRRLRAKDGLDVEDPDAEVVETTEMELAPNMQALSTWMYNHDNEWHDAILRRKKEEAAFASAEDDGETEVSVNITYNQKSDLELQEKMKKPSQ